MSLATKVVLASVVLGLTMPVMAQVGKLAETAEELLPGETTEQALERGARRLFGDSWVKGGTMCGAGESNLGLRPSTYLCDCGTNTFCAASYINSTVVGLGLCTAQNWATCQPVEDEISGTRQEKTEAAVSNIEKSGTYALISDGIGVGDDTAGGFVGTASSLVTSGSISYNEAEFLTSDAFGTKSVVRLCIIPSSSTTATSHTTCGPKRTALPGTFKFSLYGSTWGANYANAVTDKTWLTFRTRTCFHGMTELKVNNVGDGTGIVGTTTQVTSISVKQADLTVLSYSFPTSYMFGQKSDCTSDTVSICTPTGTKTVSITAATASESCGGPGLYIDYGFELVDLNTIDKWFAYDPLVATSTVQANQVCSASNFNTHALCNATDITKELLYDTAKASTKCVAATCTAADCCKAAVTVVWSASAATATLLANKLAVPGYILAAAGPAMAGILSNLQISGLTCVATGPSAAGTLELTMDSSTKALADSQFPRWIAKGIAKTMGCDESQVDVWLKAATRRLTTDGAGRRLASTVSGTFNVYNPNRGRNIGLGIGLGLVAPGLGLGLGFGLDKHLRDQTTPAPVTPVPVTLVPVAPVVVPTEAPQEGSSMPLWAGILLALALLAAIGAAVFFLMPKKEKKKRAIKKSVPVVEEIVPMLAPAPVFQSVQTYQPAPVQTFQPYAPVEYVSAPTYAAPVGYY